MPLKPDEAAALEKFRALLCEHEPGTQLYEVDRDPPDAWMETVHGRYAVEITGVYRSHKTPDPNSAKGVSITLSRFVEALEREARDAGVLSGSYTLTLSAPSSISVATKESKGRIFEYLRTTQGADSAPSAEVYRQPRSTAWRIEKQHAGSARLHAIVGGRGQDSVSWEGEIDAALRASIEESVQKKLHKLRDIPKPWILILIDAFAYSKRAAWRDSVAASPGAAAFHTIVLDVADGPAEVLASANKEWEAHRTVSCT